MTPPPMPKHLRKRRLKPGMTVAAWIRPARRLRSLWTGSRNRTTGRPLTVPRPQALPLRIQGVGLVPKTQKILRNRRVPGIHRTGAVKVSSKLWQNVRLKSPVTSCVCPSFSRLYVCLVLCVSVLVSACVPACIQYDCTCV